MAISQSISSLTQAISAISAPPLMSDPANFNARAEVFLPGIDNLADELEVLRGQLNTLRTQYNTFATQANSTATAINTSQANANTYRDQAQGFASQAQSQASAAQVAAGQAQTAQVAAESAETAAAGYASQAQATNPDTPIRINPNAISADFTLASGYNGVSAGPIRINAGVQVTVARNSHWSIV